MFPYDFYITTYRLAIPSTTPALFPVMRAESDRRSSLASLIDSGLPSTTSVEDLNRIKPSGVPPHELN
ncbi:hypothetical protein PS15m_010093 [Mucor circinelloides]